MRGNHYGGTSGTFQAVVCCIMRKRRKTSGLLTSGPTLHSDCERLAALGLSL